MKTKTNSSLTTGLLLSLVSCGLIWLTSVDLVAQSEQPKRKPVVKKEATEKKPTKKESKKGESSITAIVGGDIHTVTGGLIRQGTILIEDDKIKEVGQSVEIPDGATIIDAKGKVISPGFVSINMSGVGIQSTPSGSNKLEDSLDPFDRNLKYSLGVGITTGCISLSTGGGRGRGRAPREGEPEEIFLGLETPVQEFVTEAMIDLGENEETSRCPCCGLPILPTEPITQSAPSAPRPRKMAVLKMSYGNLEAMLLKEDVFYSPSPGSLNGALNRHNWRKQIKAAREAIKAKEKEDAEKLKAASSKSSTSKSSTASKSTTRKSSSSSKSKVSPELMALLKGEIDLRVRANTVDEIRDMVELASELGYGIVIEGGTEAWIVARELGSAEVGVIYTPRSRRQASRGRPDDSGSNFVSPQIFQDTGVPFAISTLSNRISTNGLAGRDLTSLPLEAAFAVRGGADQRTALESLTITPAKMMGLEDRIGSIEVGKDADILILNGHPLDYRTYVEQAIVAGKVAYDRAKDRVYPVYDRED